MLSKDAIQVMEPSLACMVQSALDTDITKIIYNVGKTKFTNYTKNILKINIYARKVGRKHFTVHSKLNFVV